MHTYFKELHYNVDGLV